MLEHHSAVLQHTVLCFSLTVLSYTIMVVCGNITCGIEPSWAVPPYHRLFCTIAVLCYSVTVPFTPLWCFAATSRCRIHHDGPSYTIAVPCYSITVPCYTITVLCCPITGHPTLLQCHATASRCPVTPLRCFAATSQCHVTSLWCLLHHYGVVYAITGRPPL